MKNIIILVILTFGLVFTSLVKNKTRLLEKQLANLNKEVNNLNYNLQEANLELEFITSPENISLLAKEFLDEDFSYYKKSQIKNIKEAKNQIVISKTKKTFDPVVYSRTTFLNIKKDDAKKIELPKEIIKIDSNKIKRWAAIQVLKFMAGIPSIPGK